jgi:hypothetical protein
MMGALAATVISHYRKVQTGKLVPESTVERMKTQYETRLTEMRTDHNAEMAGLRADRGALLVAKQRDADDWRAAYHLSDENRKISEERMDEVVENSRLALAVVRALPHPQVVNSHPREVES